MKNGKTLFAQLMDFLPWSTFDRIVARYNGKRAVRTLPCATQFQVMAFAQITYRESLRDIEACLSAQSTKLYHMGFRDPVRRSTLADANETRDWRIYAEFAQRLIAQARRLYADDHLELDLASTVYALDSTTIDPCLTVFPWHTFVRQRLRSRCTLCLICEVTSQVLSIFLMANCTMFMPSICYSPSLAPST